MSSDKPLVRSLKLKSRQLPILVMILVIIQLLFPFKVWVLLLSGFAGMLILSFLWALSLKRNLIIAREVRFDWKQVGDRLRERVILENHGWSPGFWVELNDHSDMREYNISSVTEIRGRRSQNWHTEGVCNQRGLYTLGPVTLETGDPFGIFKVTVDYREAANMMVAPPVISLPEIEIAAGGRAGEGRSPVKSLTQTVTSAGVREFAPGDSLRWLHWPTTARTGKPFIRVFDDDPASDWRILLDLDSRVQVGEGKNSTEEHGIILAASLVNRGLEQGRPVGFVSQGDELAWHPPDIGDTHLWSILRSLAKVRPGKLPLTQLLERVRESLGPRTSLIIITANISLEWLDALELLRRNGIVPSVLLLDPVSFGGRGDVSIMRQQLTKLGITHTIIKSDLLDQPEQETSSELSWLLSKNIRPNISFSKWENLWNKLVQGLRTWGLLLLFFFGFARALNFAVRGLEGGLIWTMIFGGAAIGWLFARSNLSGRWAALFSALAGIQIAVLRIGNFGGPIRNAFADFINWINQVIAWWYEAGDPPDIYPLLVSLVSIGERLTALGFRLFGWFVDLFESQPVYDPVVIAFLWGLAIWATSVWTLWCLIRYKNTLLALLPGILLVAVSLAMIRQSSFYLTLIFGTACALLVITNFDFRERIWKTTQVRYKTGIQSNIAMSAFGLAFGLMSIAAVMPSISVNRIADIFQQLAGENQEGEFASSLGLESRPEPQDVSVLDALRRGGLPNSHLINSGPELSEQVVMVARLEMTSGSILEEDEEALTPIYLRSLSYDSYTGRGWLSRDTKDINYRPGEQLPPQNSENGYQLRQQIQFVEGDGDILYSIGEPISVDQDFKVAWRIYDEANGIYDMFGTNISGEIYRADSFVPMYTEDELRSAGQDYPAWIEARYLSLPDFVPERVHTLARDLTATELNPYDRAIALESYLRTIPYTLEVDTGPPDQDITDYFLFDLQKGYCDYYATSMVVMARAAGFPARYVIGYIGETYEEINQVYLITADQAHAWAEVYFPGYGWIPFEPTGGRAALDRLEEQPAALPEDFELDLTPLVPESSMQSENWSLILGLGFAVVLVLFILVWAISDTLLYLTPVGTLPAKVFRRLYKTSLRIGMPLEPGDTPFEIATKFNRYLTILGARSRWSDWTAANKITVDHITEIYVGQLFSGSDKKHFDKRAFIRAYKKLRRMLWILWILTKLYRFKFLRSFLGSNVRRYVTEIRGGWI